ncbi:DTW domain-containing protein 2 [Dermatophagoides farinae]|uniref:tRNA-uridine aminocarboxypropyltransferase n=2 Tax=Dermatophagoides farinae TaxID=6954 RepID=A0A922LCM9_DERFA|nr:DTW domain-containing protein 2 [Dermatophagoides farinae]
MQNSDNKLHNDHNDDDDDEQFLFDMAEMLVEPPTKRVICSQCQRPEPVCFCSDIDPILQLQNHLIILQHPNELKRCLRTTKILELSIPNDNYHLFNGKRFPMKKFPELFDLIEQRETILLYPSPMAESLGIEGIQPNKNDDQFIGFNAIILDGTWHQARVLYNCNPFLHSLRCIKLESTGRSQYVIRTQPTEACLSTVEAAAILFSRLENDPSIHDRLTRPLRAICDYQLNMGAVKHQSKEYLITNGLYQRPLNRRLKKKVDQQIVNNNPISDLKNLVHLL